MNSLGTINPPAQATLAAIVDAAGRQIPPLWPLDSHVAVNPYLGQTGERLAETGARLRRVGGGAVTMPRSWYLDRLDDGSIGDADLAEALAASPHDARPASVAALKDLTGQACAQAAPLPTIADLAAAHSGIDWPGIIADRIGNWAGSYFDAGQALWIAPQDKSAWAAWRIHATHDVTPEILGLAGFASFVADAPASPLEAIARAAERLGLGQASLETYCHQLLLSLGGWAQMARYRLWQAELVNDSDATLAGMLAIRMLWEEALYAQYQSRIADAWAETRDAHARPIAPDQAEIVDEILQEASERAVQRVLAETLAEPIARGRDRRPSLQAAFCIDVRSEVFRRALEAVDPAIQTLGFAGFFGVFAKHRRFASDVEEMRLPVLLKPSVGSCSTDPDNTEFNTRFRARARRAWGRFKLAAVSSLAFVEAMGPVYAIKLIRDALGFHSTPVPKEPKPEFAPALDLPARIEAAATVLRAMSLTRGFARVVLLAGHGANVVNNPHASGLHCGACGGYSGEVNARLLAGLLNDREVRAGLAERGIEIPADTLFIAGLHDTTTDAVTLYAQDADSAEHKADLKQVRAWLEAAGQQTRAERALRLPRAANGKAVPRRARNWAEVRPEWALAGCRAFIAAPRSRTTGRNLEGRAFLHDYDWRQDRDNDFPVLELIMTAPVVVASWISLQYYGSTVARETFGAGNKLLHNVVGGVGVFEGNGGLLRAGLPWQSVHDGERHVHEPLRLSVCIEAPREAMTAVLERHPQVRALFDNRWLHLFALEEAGRMTWRYTGDLRWAAASDAAVAAQPIGAASRTISCAAP